MPLLGAQFPDFSAMSTMGPISFHKWLNNSWAILFTHPGDFTPVCTTELAKVLELDQEFKKRNVKLIALSCDSVESHERWMQDIEAYNERISGQFGKPVSFPIIADPERDIVTRFGMLDPDMTDVEGNLLPARTLFIIDPDKKLRLAIIYPATTGRNFDEVLRVLDSLQVTSARQVATPAHWQSGEACMLFPSMSSKEARVQFKDVEKIDLPSGKSYLRLTPQPSF